MDCTRHRWSTLYYTERFHYQECADCKVRRLLPMRPVVMSAVDREWLEAPTQQNHPPHGGQRVRRLPRPLKPNLIGKDWCP